MQNLSRESATYTYWRSGAAVRRDFQMVLFTEPSDNLCWRYMRCTECPSGLSMSVSKITRKCMDGFGWNVACQQMSTNWLTSEPDPEHIPDLGTRFAPDFCISAGYVKKLLTDFDAILCVDRCLGCIIWLGFQPDPDRTWMNWLTFSPIFWAWSGSQSRSRNRYLHWIFEFQRDIWRSYGRISMKFCALIAAGVCTNWLGLEPDLYHSTDPGAGFTPDFLISVGYLKKLWTDFDEILCVDSFRDLDESFRFWAGSGS